MFTLGFDARATEPGFKAHFGRGTGRYAAELLAELARLVPNTENSDVQILKLTGGMLEGHSWERQMIQLLPFGRQTAETQVFLPRRLGRIPADLLHFMSHGDATARSRKPYLVTVLDLIPLRFPELYKADKPDWRFRLAREFEKRSILEASGILAISEATKRDVIELLGIPAEKIWVTPLGVRADFKPRPLNTDDYEALVTMIKGKFGLPPKRPMLLYVGGIDQRKNIPFLLNVFRDVIHQSSSDERPIFVMVGKYEEDLLYPALLRQIAALGLEHDVRLLGYVSDADMQELYQAATAKIFPSLYEGFGLPVLEAMACGVPVIAGKNSSIPEVAGDVAKLVSDNDQEAWGRAIQEVLLSPKYREECSSKGVLQAKKFTWEHTAHQTLNAYRHFYKQLLL